MKVIVLHPGKTDDSVVRLEQKMLEQRLGIPVTTGHDHYWAWNHTWDGPKTTAHWVAWARAVATNFDVIIVRVGPDGAITQGIIRVIEMAYNTKASVIKWEHNDFSDWRYGIHV